MTTYFIDAQGFCVDGTLLIKELCIMDANNIFTPYQKVFSLDVPMDILSKKSQYDVKYLIKNHHYLHWDEGSTTFCPSCVSSQYDVNINSIFYVLDKIDGVKINTLKKHFPNWRLVNYSKRIADLPDVPTNIKCLYRDHGKHCAYKHCLAMATDYCKTC